MKKFSFVFVLMCILAFSINICYASDYDSELYGEVGQKEFEFAVLNDGNYLITVETSDVVNSILVDDADVGFDTNSDGYEFTIYAYEGIHNLSFTADEENFCADAIYISLSEEKQVYTIYAGDYASHDFTSTAVTSSLEIDDETVTGLKFVDTSKDSNGRSVTYEFTVPEDGIYSVVSYITRDTNAWASANTSYLDGIKLNLTECDDSDKNGIVGDKTYITKKVYSYVELSAGRHTLKIDAFQRVAAAYRDYLLQHYKTDIIFIGGKGESAAADSLSEIVIQAEKYDTVSQDILNANGGTINPIASIETADGGAVVRVNTTVAPDNGGYSFTYRFNVTKAGIYNFYIHGGSTTSRYISPFEYSIGGSDFISVNEAFAKYADSEVEGYKDLAGHHYHMEGIYLEEGEQELTIRCSQVRASDSTTYYIFLDSITFVETGIHVSNVENAEIGQSIEIIPDISLPGRIKGDTSDAAIEFTNVGSDAISITDGIITVNGGGSAEVYTSMSTDDESYETTFNINTTINDIGVCEYKILSDGSSAAVVKNYANETRKFSCVKIQRNSDGIAQALEIQPMTLSAGGTVVLAVNSDAECSAEMFLVADESNYSPVSDYLTK